MRQRLREIAQGGALNADLLAIQAEMIGIPEHLLEQQPRTLQARGIVATGAGKCFHQPESANVEGSLRAFQAIRRLIDIVAIDQAIGNQAAIPRGTIDGVDGAEHARVAGRHEKDQGHQK